MDIELNKLRKEFIDFKENAKYKNLQKGRRESIFKTITKKTIINNFKCNFLPCIYSFL